jgi:dTDP-4-amino-4,6-dideoxygalactose transaminase
LEAALHSEAPSIAEPIRFQHPELPDGADIERYLVLARDARWFSNGGPCHQLLRDRLERFLEHRCNVVLTANGTMGLVLALRALLGERPAGSLVIVPSFTFPATVEAIRWCGLQPLWVDVERSGWHLDPQALSDALTGHGSEVAGVLACSTFGTAPSKSQAAAWRELCSQAHVPLIVDSAPGFGSRDEDGGQLGTQGDAEVFSFHATKPFAIGEGGAVTTSDPALAKRLTALTNFGFDPSRAVGDAFGLNAKLSEIHAAIGLAVLDRFDAILAARRTRAERMRSQLEPAGYRFQAGSRSSAWQFVPVLAPSLEVREEVLAAANRQAIEIRTYHPPLHRMPVFASHPSHGQLTRTDELAERSLSLPLANDLSDEQVARIVTLLLECAACKPDARSHEDG